MLFEIAMLAKPAKAPLQVCYPLKNLQGRLVWRFSEAHILRPQFRRWEKSELELLLRRCSRTWESLEWPLYSRRKSLVRFEQFKVDELGLSVQIFRQNKEIKTIGVIFEAIDDDFSGTISEKELGKLFKVKGLEVSSSELKDIVQSLYIVDSQYITFLEFEAALLGLDYFRNHQLLKIVFSYFDTVGDGSIDHSDLINCFRRFGRSPRLVLVMLPCLIIWGMR